MAITLESRAIHISPDLPDLFVTAVHIDEPAREFHNSLISAACGLPQWMAVSRSELFEFWQALPDHVKTDFPDSKRSWLEDDGLFVQRSLELQLEGDVIGLAGGNPFHGSHSDPVASTLDNFMRQRRFDKASALSRFSSRQAVLATWALARLHGVYVGSEQAEQVSAALHDVYAQDIPISHSPGIEGVTLKDLATKGVKSASFFPLIGGVYVGVQHLFQAQMLLAFELVVAGAGMTLCTISTLWIADKLFAGIKHIGHDEKDPPQRRRSR